MEGKESQRDEKGTDGDRQKERETEEGRVEIC